VSNLLDIQVQHPRYPTSAAPPSSGPQGPDRPGLRVLRRPLGATPRWPGDRAGTAPRVWCLHRRTLLHRVWLRDVPTEAGVVSLSVHSVELKSRCIALHHLCTWRTPWWPANFPETCFNPS